jgi:hypothetical protein
MTTSTKELIGFLESKALIASYFEDYMYVSHFQTAAQFLRELDKPDCVWKEDESGNF